MNHSIVTNAIRISVKTLVSTIVPLITFPYLSRILQVEVLGQYYFSASIVGYFTLLAGLGINDYAIREGSRVRDNSEKLSSFANEIFSVNLVSTACSAALLLVAVFTVPKLEAYRALILISGIELCLTLFGREYIFIIAEDFTYLSRVQIAFQLVSIPLTFLLIKSPRNLTTYVWLRLFAVKGPQILYGLRNGRYIRPRLVSLPGAFKKHLKPVFILFGSSIANTLHLLADTTILGWLVGDAASGYYAVAIKIYTIFKSIFLGVLNVTIPRLSANGGKDSFRPLFSGIFNMIAFALLPAAAGLFMLSENAVRILAGEGYYQSVLPLRILCASLIFAMGASLYCLGVLIPTNREKIFLAATWFSASLNIATNIIFIPRFEQNAAAATTAASELVLLLIGFFATRKDVDNRSNLGILAKDLLGCGGIAACCLLVKRLSLALWPETVICVLMSVGVYLVIQWAVKNPVLSDCFREMKKLIRMGCN